MVAFVTVQFSHIPGGKYRARQNDDGTWDVLDMPVFSLVPKGKKGAPKDITEDDLRAAVREHQRKYKDDQFMARVNVLHNYGVQPATPAGFFLPRIVKPFRMNGKMQATIFADLMGVPDAVFRDMEARGLPYCSVEVRTYEPLVFGALALLDTEPPFFEFPIISIGDKEFTDVTKIATDSDAVALARFHFAEALPMPEDMEEKKKDDVEEAEMAEDEGMDIKAIVKAVKDGSISVADMEEIVAAIDARNSEGEEEVPITDGVIDEPVAAMSHEDAKLAGRVAALEDYRDKAEQEKETVSIFAAEVEGLEADGFTLSDKTRGTFRKFAEQGPDALRMFSASFRENAIQDPPSDLLGMPTGDIEWPDEVMQFSNKSAEDFADAKAAYRDWSQMPDDRFRSPLGKYLMREVS